MHSYLKFFSDHRNLMIGSVFTLIFLFEHIYPQRKFPGIMLHDLRNFGFGVLNLGISFVGGYYFSVFLNNLTLHHVGILNIYTGWWTIITGLLIADILMYWWHRLNHKVPFLWQFHAMHHRDEMMNSTTAVRFHVVELILSFAFRFIFYAIFGISASVLLVFSTIHFIMIIFHHSNIKIAPQVDHFLRIIITSPEMHRIHHSNKWKETNSNYTSILSCWDWVFKSYVPHPEAPVTFGIPE